jgi:hypothetical protein
VNMMECINMSIDLGCCYLHTPNSELFSWPSINIDKNKSLNKYCTPEPFYLSFFFAIIIHFVNHFLLLHF